MQRPTARGAATRSPRPSTTSVRLAPVLAAACIALTACRQFSIGEHDDTAGLNGSFEIVRNGLPVNWHVYYPAIRENRADFAIDSTDFVDGHNSIRFVVRHAGEGPAVANPGFFRGIAAEENATCRASFWLKNLGCRVRFRLGSEKPNAMPWGVTEMLGDDAMPAGAWKKLEYTYTVPATFDNIRFELNVVHPGTLWVDDVQLERIDTAGTPTNSSEQAT